MIEREKHENKNIEASEDNNKDMLKGIYIYIDFGNVSNVRLDVSYHLMNKYLGIFGIKTELSKAKTPTSVSGRIFFNITFVT